MLDCYPTPQEYLVNANPDVISNKYYGIRSHKQAFSQRVAKIEDIASAYGEETAITFIMGWIARLNKWVNVNEDKKINQEQAYELAIMLLTDFKSLKISEWAYCITLIKKGKYGDFYGSISPTMIIAAFDKYISERTTRFAALNEAPVDFDERANDIKNLLNE